MRKIAFFICIFIIFNFIYSKEKTDNKEQIVNEGKKKTFFLSLGAGIRMISENLYKEIYGNSNLSFNADLGFRIWKSIELFLHSDILSINGETTLTKEKTSFRLIPIELGFRFLMEKKQIAPYIGAGGGYYAYKDEMFIQNESSKVSGSQIGFFTEAGFKYRFVKSFFFDLKVKYIFLEVDPEDPEEDTNGTIYTEKRNLGGLAIIAGIGISI